MIFKHFGTAFQGFYASFSFEFLDKGGVWTDNLPFHILNFDIFIEVQMKKRQALRLSLNTAPSRGQKSYSFSNKTRQVDGNSGILHQQI